MNNKQKDRWDKSYILMKGVLTPIAILIIGIIINKTLKDNEMRDSDNKLYAELLTKREEVESNVRKDMFEDIINSLLKKETKSQDMDVDLTNLEFLARNFHEEIDLKPLFLHFRKLIEITKEKPEVKKEYIKRINGVAQFVRYRQRQSLEANGIYKELTFIFKDNKLRFPDTLTFRDTLKFPPVTLMLDKIMRRITVSLNKDDSVRAEFNTKLIIYTIDPDLPDPLNKNNDPKTVIFKLDAFNFPMIDNTFLSYDQRCALVLNYIDSDTAHVEIILFSRKYASLKDRTDIDYYLLKRLIHENIY